MLKVLALAVALLLHQQQPPTFKSGVELVAVDVHVVNRQGNPIEDIRADEFEVTISGRQRRVASVELVSYGNTRAAAIETSVPARAGPRGTAERPRRMFILAVDELSLHASNALAAVTAAERFIDKLQPDDLVGVYAYPTGTAKHDLTSDHGAVRRVLRGIAGLFDEPPGRINMSPSEVIDISSGDQDAEMTVLRRECVRGGCSRGDIKREATSRVGFMEMRVSQSVGGLRGLVRGLAEIPGRKILVLVSGGLISTDRGTGRVNSSSEVIALGHQAALANLSVFALHLDWSFLQSLSSRGGPPLSYFRDSNMAATGLEQIAGTAGGTVIRVHVTSPDVAFDRVLRETSAHYLLGVEMEPADRDGNAHAIRVKINRRGATVRSRSAVVIPRR